MSDETATLTWRATLIGGKTTPNDGTLCDAGASVGRVIHVKGGLREGWEWTCTATGRGADYGRHRGIKPTKDEAKAALVACYLALLSRHSDNRAGILEHAAELRRSDELWSRRGTVVPSGSG